MSEVELVSYFDTLREMTDDPALLAAIGLAEDQIAIEQARDQVREIEKTLIRSRQIQQDYRRWLRRPRCWWCGR